MTDNVTIAQLAPDWLNFTARFDDFVLTGTDYLVVRLYDITTEHGQHVVEVNRFLEIDITGHSLLGPDSTLKPAQRTNTRLNVKVGLKTWPFDKIKRGDKITFTALPKGRRLIWVKDVKTIAERQLVK